MLELLFQLFGEIILQVVIEALAEAGLHALAEPFRRPPNRWLAALGYLLLGAAAGGLSLLAFSAHLVTTPGLRIANLIITPVAVGLLMCVLGAWRARRGAPLLRIDKFAYGYLFALSLALVRFTFAH